jgi:hypothetical protein
MEKDVVGWQGVQGSTASMPTAQRNRMSWRFGGDCWAVRPAGLGGLVACANPWEGRRDAVGRFFALLRSNNDDGVHCMDGGGRRKQKGGNRRMKKNRGEEGRRGGYGGGIRGGGGQGRSGSR